MLKFSRTCSITHVNEFAELVANITLENQPDPREKREYPARLYPFEFNVRADGALN